MIRSHRDRIPSRLPVAIEDRLWALSREYGYRAAAIHSKLVEEFGYGAVSEKTVQRRVRALKALDTSGEWSMLGADADEIGPVLDVLAAVIEEHEGQILSLTNAEAAWIVKLRTGRPDLPPYDTWVMARLYMAREARNETFTGDLDAYLAFAQWRDAEHFERYCNALDNEWIETNRVFIYNLRRSGHPEYLARRDQQHERFNRERAGE